MTTDDALAARDEAAALARLRAAEAAVAFAAAVIAEDNAPAAGELHEMVARLNQEIRAWRKTGRGWFEERTRPRKPRKGQRSSGIEGAEQPLGDHGPYYYFRWRDSNKRLRTQYFGKQRPEAMDRRPTRGMTVLDHE